jgi:uncharacterized membrane protein
VALGVVAVFAPVYVLGELITLLPDMAVRLVGGALLLYLGLRLARNACKSVIRSREGGSS